MAKWNHADVIRGGYEVIRQSADYLCVCGAMPATREEAVTTYALGGKAISGVFSWGEAEIGDGSRKLTMSEITGVPISATGIFTHLALVDDARLLAAFPASPEKQVYEGDYTDLSPVGFVARQLSGGKWAHQDTLEQGFQVVITDATMCCVTSQFPSTRSEAYDVSGDGGYCLGRIAVSSANFGWAAMDSIGGQVCTVDTLTGVSIVDTGKWRYRAFIDGTRVLAVTTNLSQEQLYSGTQIMVESKQFQFPQAS
jgi:hypothetical protein